MRAATLAFVLCTASVVHAAPWSIELPADYTEVPGAADAQLAQIRSVKDTVSVDAQVYTSPDNNVQLTRMTWLHKSSDAPTRFSLEMLDRGVVAGAAKEATKHISDSRHFEGDTLIGESRDEANGMLMIQRKLYAVDASGVVHLFLTICAGEAGQLAACEKAQQSMQLTLPNPGSLSASSGDDRRHDLAYQLGRLVGVVLVALLVIGIVLWFKKRST